MSILFKDLFQVKSTNRIRSTIAVECCLQQPLLYEIGLLECSGRLESTNELRSTIDDASSFAYQSMYISLENQIVIVVLLHERSDECAEPIASVGKTWFEHPEITRR